jgi:chromosome segregation ATPase
LEQLALELQQAQQHLFRQQVGSTTAEIASLRREVSQIQMTHESTSRGLTSMVESRCREMHERCATCEDATGRHGQDQQVVKVQLDQLRTVFNDLQRNSSAFGELQGTLDSLANHRAALDAKHADLDERMGTLDDKIQYVASKHQHHSDALEAQKGAHSKLADELQRHGKMVSSSFADQAHQITNAHTKLNHVLNQLSEHQASRALDSAAIDDLKRGHAQFMGDHTAHQDRCQRIEDRMNRLEGALDASTGDHGRRIQLAQKQAQDVHDHVKSQDQAHQAHHHAVLQRLKAVESAAGDSVSRSELDGMHRQMWDITSNLQAEQAARERDLAGVKSHMNSMDHTLSTGFGKHEQHINDLMAAHMQLRDKCGSFEDKNYASDTNHAVLEERLKGVETLLGGALAEHGKELQQAKRQLQVLHGRLDQAQTSIGSMRGKSAVGKRFRDLDQILEHGGPDVDPTPPASLVGGEALLAQVDTDYFRQVSRIIIKDDAVDARSGKSGTSPNSRSTMSRVASLPALIPSC